MAASLVCACAFGVRTRCARYEALFSPAIAMADPTHRRKVQLELATRSEIIGEHSRENVTHQLGSLSSFFCPVSPPFVSVAPPRYGIAPLCHFLSWGSVYPSFITFHTDNARPYNAIAQA